MRACAIGTGSLKSIKVGKSIGFGRPGSTCRNRKSPTPRAYMNRSCGECIRWASTNPAALVKGLNRKPKFNHGPDDDTLPESVCWIKALVADHGDAHRRQFHWSSQPGRGAPRRSCGFHDASRCTRCSCGRTCHCCRNFLPGIFLENLRRIPMSEFRPPDRTCQACVRRPLQNPCLCLQRTV